MEERQKNRRQRGFVRMYAVMLTFPRSCICLENGDGKVLRYVENILQEYSSHDDLNMKTNPWDHQSIEKVLIVEDSED